MKRTVTVICCLLLAGVCVLFSSGPSPARADMIDGIVAVVDDSVIMYSDLIRKMDELGAKVHDAETTKKVVQLMVEEMLIKKVYKSMGLPNVDPKQAEEVSKNMSISKDSAAVYIMRSTLMEFMVRSRVVVTDNMVQAYFEGNKQYVGKESIHLKQILIGNNNKEKAEEAVKAIRDGKDFDAAVLEYSDNKNPDAADIGWISMNDLAEDAANALALSKPGEVVGPVALGGNILIYQVVDRGLAGGKPIEEVRGEITEMLQEKARNEAFDHWLKMIMSEHYIGIFI
jgi:parvulin-like peptidyl-prolyl isomerase